MSHITGREVRAMAGGRRTTSAKSYPGPVSMKNAPSRRPRDPRPPAPRPAPPKPPGRVPADRYRIQAIDRAAHILDCFQNDKPEMSVREIASRTGLHKSTTHRILMALHYNGLIDQDGPA